MPETAPNVGLFVTCLVDLFRPSVGFAAVKLLETAGCKVEVPRAQTCCGQPAYNSGDRKDAKALARNVIDAFADFDYVVAPSGSCAGMVRKHYPALLADDAIYAEKARDLASRTYELIEFLVDVRGLEKTDAHHEGKVAYHDSCSSLRDLGVKDQPRNLLRTVSGLDLVDIPDAESCCGFGGVFALKYGDISGEIVRKKAEAIESTGAATVCAADLGCLLNIAGRLQRAGSGIKVRHVAEILAGAKDVPAIAEGRG